MPRLQTVQFYSGRALEGQRFILLYAVQPFPSRYVACKFVASHVIPTVFEVTSLQVATERAHSITPYRHKGRAGCDSCNVQLRCMIRSGVPRVEIKEDRTLDLQLRGSALKAEARRRSKAPWFQRVRSAAYRSKTLCCAYLRAGCAFNISSSRHPNQ